MYMEVVMNLFFIIILSEKIFTQEFISLHPLHDSLRSDVYPRNSYLMMPKSLFIIKNDFSDLKLYSLRISAIFNKKKNFHVSNFS